MPSDVDKDKKEMYLADDVFLKMFKMDKATFFKIATLEKEASQAKS